MIRYAYLFVTIDPILFLFFQLRVYVRVCVFYKHKCDNFYINSIPHSRCQVLAEYLPGSDTGLFTQHHQRRKPDRCDPPWQRQYPGPSLQLARDRAPVMRHEL